MHLETVRHEGPGRLGKLFFEDAVFQTPSLLWSSAAGSVPGSFLTLTDKAQEGRKGQIISYGTVLAEPKIHGFGILPSHPSGYDVAEDIAEYAVGKTMEFASAYPGYGAVIEGGKHVALRKRCAENFRDRPLLKIADSDRLIENQRKLVETVIAIKESANPNTALYMPDVPPHFFPLLSYMGVDLFDLTSPILGTYENRFYTLTGVQGLDAMRELPCPCSPCRDAQPENLTRTALLSHNISTAVASVKEIREAFRMGRMRNLVEEKASTDAVLMGALRILDREASEFLEKYTPLHMPSANLGFKNTGRRR